MHTIASCGAESLKCRGCLDCSPSGDALGELQFPAGEDRRSTRLANGAVKWNKCYLTPSLAISFHAPLSLLVSRHDKGSQLWSHQLDKAACYLQVNT